MVQQRVFIDHGARPSAEPPLTIISYNILADKYAVSGWHSYCPPEHLQWSSRLPRLIQELRNYSADIICLQEVPPSQGRQMPAGAVFPSDASGKCYRDDSNDINSCSDRQTSFCTAAGQAPSSLRLVGPWQWHRPQARCTWAWLLDRNTTLRCRPCIPSEGVS